MKQLFRRLHGDARGATAIEYALIAGLIALAIVPALGPLQDALAATYGKIANAIPQ